MIGFNDVFRERGYGVPQDAARRADHEGRPEAALPLRQSLGKPLRRLSKQEVVSRQGSGSTVAVAAYRPAVEGFLHCPILARPSAPGNNRAMTLGGAFPISGAAWVGRAARWALDAVLPPRCLSCEATVDTQGQLCATCWRAVRFLADPMCSCCGLPFPFESPADGGNLLCAGCIAEPPRFRKARAVFAYDDGSRGAVLAFKHGDRTDAAPAFGAWMARAGAALLADADLMVPVPLHRVRLFRRRYNQAALLAHAAARASGRPISADALERTRNTPQQGATRVARLANVRGVFRVRPSRVQLVQGKRVVLIDDVLTTGATAEACASVLLRAGATHVDVLTLARVVREGAL